MYRIRDRETKGFVQGIRWTVQRMENEKLRLPSVHVERKEDREIVRLRGGGFVFPRVATVPFNLYSGLGCPGASQPERGIPYSVHIE